MKTFERLTAGQAFERGLDAFMLDTMIADLQYLYDEPMDTPENRAMWKQAALGNDAWRGIIAFDEGTPCGFLHYSIREEALYIGGIHIPPAYRYMPSILRGLLAGALADEQGSYEKVIWHVNKKNEESQKNFLRFGRIVGDSGLSYRVEMTREGMEKIKRLGQRS